jgi:hypothetical protein
MKEKGDIAMRFPMIVLLVVLALLGLTAGVACSGSSIAPARLAITGIPGGDDSQMQQLPGGPPTGGLAPPGARGGTGSSDVTTSPAGPAVKDPKIQDALDGVRDYEVSYDTSKSHAELTPPELTELGVTYAGEESPVAQRTKALETLNLVTTLADRYKIVSDEFSAKTDEDFSPDDPETTLNYFQPREDPFSIPDLIPKELQPEVEGTGLEGTVDPDLLDQLLSAQYTANLRFIPISIVGVMENGPYRGCIYTIGGGGQSIFIQEGDTQCMGNYSINAAQISEDYVVFILTGYYGRGCRYPATSGVVRSFHIRR